MSQEIIEKSFDFEQDSKLTIKNIQGSIRVTSGDTKTINIKAIKDLSRGDHENTIINIEKLSDGSILVEAKNDDTFFLKTMRPCSVEFIIETPPATPIQVDAISSSVVISGIEAAVLAKTISGRIEISDLVGDFNAKTISGVIIGKGLIGNVNLDSISGKIVIEDGKLSNIKSSTISGSMRVETQSLDEGSYKFNTISGKVIFIVPPKTNCSLYASSLSGRFKTDLKTTKGTVGKNKWHIDLEGGGPEIKMKSISGGLRLLTSKNANAKTPFIDTVEEVDRIEILEKIENGDLTVDEAILELT